MKRIWKKLSKYSLSQIGIVTIVLGLIIGCLILILSQLEPTVVVSESGKQPCTMCDITIAILTHRSMIEIAGIAITLCLIARFMPKEDTLIEKSK